MNFFRNRNSSRVRIREADSILRSPTWDWIVLDGANVEIREQVGAENFYLFGYNVDEIKALRAEGYRPWELVSQDPELAAVLLTLHDGTFAPRDSQLFQPILDSLVGWDEFMVLADFRSLLRTQERIDEDWRNHNDWSRRAILNVARMGMFSSDRAIAEYAQRIWRIEPQEVPLCPPEGHT